MEEKKVIINENVDNMLKELEGLLTKVLPVKNGAEFINEVLYAPLKDETKELIIAEILAGAKEKLNGEDESV